MITTQEERFIGRKEHTPRPMTKAHFERRLLTAGFKPEFFGYWRLPPPCENTSVYAHGTTLRSKLADLFNSMDFYQAEKQKRSLRYPLALKKARKTYPYPPAKVQASADRNGIPDPQLNLVFNTDGIFSQP